MELILLLFRFPGELQPIKKGSLLSELTQEKSGGLPSSSPWPSEHSPLIQKELQLSLLQPLLPLPLSLLQLLLSSLLHSLNSSSSAIYQSEWMTINILAPSFLMEQVKKRFRNPILYGQARDLKQGYPRATFVICVCVCDCD